MNSFIVNIMNKFGYMGIIFLIAIENIFPPIPSEVILTLGGFMTSQDGVTMNLFGVIISSTVGSVVGAIILYYIGNVLLAEKNSYIVIDEPETYLNPSIYKQLWDVLEENRTDCQFVYISHDIDFIRSRRDMRIVWVKKYLYPNEWDMKLIDENDLLPNELLIQIYGSKNKIMFCEGTKESLDYDVYSIVFGEDYYVVPLIKCIDSVPYGGYDTFIVINADAGARIEYYYRRRNYKVRNYPVYPTYTNGFFSPKIIVGIISHLV